MNLGKITIGNVRDIINAIKQGKRVCVVFDRESEAYIRNLLFYPTNEEKEALALCKSIGTINFTEETYSEALLIYAAYDNNRNLANCFTKEMENKPCLAYRSQDMLTNPVKYLAWLQARFDMVYLL